MNGIISAIGNTPIIKLEKIFKQIKFNLYAKLEFLNPGGSAKDRSALSMIMHAIESGEINQNTIIVESSSGNMAIALAQVCSYYKLKFICVVDKKTTQQNIDLLKAYNAIIEMVNEPDPSTGEYLNARLNRVRELCNKLGNCFWPNQYANKYNSLAHKKTIHEIFEAMDGNVDFLFCATSTCGTIRGFSDYLSENKLSTKLIAVDAVGSVIFVNIKPNQKRIIPGHGAAIRPKLFNDNIADEFVLVSDLDCVKGCRSLLKSEAVIAGGSSGGIITAVEKMKEQIPNGANCIVILHDRGERYLNTIYSDSWVKDHFGEVNLSF